MDYDYLKLMMTSVCVVYPWKLDVTLGMRGTYGINDAFMGVQVTIFRQPHRYDLCDIMKEDFFF